MNEDMPDVPGHDLPPGAMSWPAADEDDRIIGRCRNFGIKPEGRFERERLAMELKRLCEGIHLQEEIRGEVEAFYHSPDFAGTEVFLEGLKRMETEAQAREELGRYLGDDPKKIRMLTCMLVCGADLHRWYQEKGISDRIFFDTMGCFTRFVKECREITGDYAFDREWWTARQVSGQLFRIGALEYERKGEKDKAVISIHIPSDAILTGENCDRSMEEARAFFGKHFPEYRDRDYICHSWLLAPELGRLLPADSHILAFQRKFRIVDVDYQGADYLQWVFKTRDLPLEKLPEKTLLQRNMKRHLSEGGKVGSGFGVWVGT